MSGFYSRLALVAADCTDSGHWVLTAPLVYLSDAARRVITVPAGFRTDLASVPRWPLAYWLTGGTADAAAVVHDYLYSTRLVSRAVADAVLREASAVSGVPWWRRGLMWAAVRVAGWRYWRNGISRGEIGRGGAVDPSVNGGLGNGCEE